jgi:hypothetical protein
MTRAYPLLLSTALCMASLGCASDPSPKQTEPRAQPIPITAEPDFGSPAERELPEYFRGAICVLALVSSDAGLDEAEIFGFFEAFRGEFFGASFKEVADGQEADFVAELQYSAKTEAFRVQDRPDIDQRIVARAEVKLTGGASRGGRSFVFKLDHAQPSSKALLTEMRPDHATVVGRALAKKCLMKLTQLRSLPAVRGARAPRALNYTYQLVFRSFAKVEKGQIIDVLAGIAGVDPSSLMQVSVPGGGTDIHLRLDASLKLGDLRAAVVQGLEGEFPGVEAKAPTEEMLIFIKGE